MQYTKKQVRQAWGKPCDASPIAPYAYRLQRDGGVAIYKNNKLVGALEAGMFRLANGKPDMNVSIAQTIADAISSPEDVSKSFKE